MRSEQRNERRAFYDKCRQVLRDRDNKITATEHFRMTNLFLDLGAMHILQEFVEEHSPCAYRIEEICLEVGVKCDYDMTIITGYDDNLHRKLTQKLCKLVSSYYIEGNISNTQLAEDIAEKEKELNTKFSPYFNKILREEEEERRKEDKRQEEEEEEEKQNNTTQSAKEESTLSS